MSRPDMLKKANDVTKQTFIKIAQTLVQLCLRILLHFSFLMVQRRQRGCRAQVASETNCDNRETSFHWCHGNALYANSV